MPAFIAPTVLFQMNRCASPSSWQSLHEYLWPNLSSSSSPSPFLVEAGPFLTDTSTSGQLPHLCLFCHSIFLSFFLCVSSLLSPQSASQFSPAPPPSFVSHHTPPTLILLCGGFAVGSPRHERSINRSPGGTSPYNTVQWAWIVSQTTQEFVWKRCDFWAVSNSAWWTQLWHRMPQIQWQKHAFI